MGKRGQKPVWIHLCWKERRGSKHWGELVEKYWKTSGEVDQWDMWSTWSYSWVCKCLSLGFCLISAEGRWALILPQIRALPSLIFIIPICVLVPTAPTNGGNKRDGSPGSWERHSWVSKLARSSSKDWYLKWVKK